ncbi:MAG: hypothetical protein ACLS37_11745 [Alistipes sp.]
MERFHAAASVAADQVENAAHDHDEQNQSDDQAIIAPAIFTPEHHDRQKDDHDQDEHKDQNIPQRFHNARFRASPQIRHQKFASHTDYLAIFAPCSKSSSAT